MVSKIYKNGHIFLIVVALMMFGVFTALAVDNWHGTDQVTMEWDTSLLSDGTPLPAGDNAKYYIYTKNEDGSNETLVTNTGNLSYTFTVPEGIKLIPGVSAARIAADGTETEQSAIAWADDPEAVMNGETFGFINYKKAAPPGQLRKKVN